MPRNSTLRPQLVSSIAKKAELSGAAISHYLGVSEAVVSRARDSDASDVVQMNRSVTTSAAACKAQSVVDDAVAAWYENSRRTQKHDENGERLDLYLYDITADEVFEAYRVWCIEKRC
jgi:hypothetical protein